MQVEKSTVGLLDHFPMIELQSLLDDNLLAIIVVLVVTGSLWSFYLRQRQRRFILTHTQPPEFLKSVLTHEQMEKSACYESEKINFNTAHSLFSLTVTLIGLMLHVDARVFRLASSVSQRLHFGGYTESPYITSWIFLVLNSLFDFLDIPWDIYGTFVIEQRWGYNKTTPATFVKDIFIDFFTNIALMTPLYFILQAVLRWAGPSSWIYATIVVIAFQGILNFLQPVIIKLKNKLTPLPEGPLLTELESLMERSNFYTKRLFVFDGSKRSGHSNAFAGGMGPLRTIALFDTLFQQMGTDEVGVKRCAAITAHEIGHQKRHHIPKQMAILSVINALMLRLTIGMVFNDRIYEQLGFRAEDFTTADGVEWPLIVGLSVALSIVDPLMVVVSVAMNAFSRKCEREADQFAYDDMGEHELPNALIALFQENNMCVDADPLYAACCLSHPPLLHRLRDLGKLQKFELDPNIAKRKTSGDEELVADVN